MPRPKGREPRIEVRRHTLKDGTVREYPCVRYFDRDGVRRRLRCGTVAEAEFERARIALEGAPAPPVEAQGRMLVSEFWPVWLADARGRLEENTLNAYEFYWAGQLEPRFGDVAFRDITPRAVSQWRVELADKGVGEESIRKCMVLLQAVFSVAVEWGEATQNPVSVVRKPRQGRRRAITVTEPSRVERLRATMLEADDLLCATLTVTLAYSGVRPAEALALERRHIRDETLLVEQAVSCGKLKLQKTGRVYRTVDLLRPLAVDLAIWMEDKGIVRDDALLFPRPDGGWWTKDDWDNWRKRHFHRHTKTLGLGTPRPYDLRHSFASLLIREQRASIVDIADQLGHAPTETLNTYSHVVREHRRKTPIDAADAILAAREGSTVNGVGRGREA
ncbi:tyrosine-type recombinase/integrase [Conexibacter sp. W3-3-2]|uniref:tyrosine-type recombinase/integrase n=1 Tax=Conexibacter sp. W3-3-2 TaxID=2675227 RepID=UPI0012B7B8B7|nr:tyrosine-type recombinase/integrase [Conexibacter sp. W3-3-2]MTD46272.1 tyrosine-type recombinase/integrase [Conexibacter sp. W3-3-2]